MSVLKKTIASILLLIAVPITVILSYTLFSNNRYDIASLIIAVLSTLAFVLSFEKNAANGKLVAVIAVMIALSVAGRFVFSPIPFFKPVTSIVIITALYFGGECGFITGAFSALLSNFYFGQGPWTPFQMMVWGLVGLLSGVLARYIIKNKLTISLWGIFSGVFYSMVMDIWTTLWADGGFNVERYFAFFATSLPIMAVYAVSNVVFLLLMTKPIGKKLQRIKTKYGI
ncbi:MULTISPECIES: ECF transporter S component [unclassified Ruminococcus]|uniref:ECF transporter S component n=1 Tax=unclassified Ruminococcus TaxID=2608920 RepID=UPI00210BE219|nr:MULTISPECIES: ECF transporter S component [unclassified Ruminococcus]MCQ4022058.1 ECF transporter S component [Ruminococcus sp. zg-924]MCQ4114378.1 ECF transporter S component [Ruminococcus sp. zg-921]